MMDKQNLTANLLRQLQSKSVSTFFINGPPGAGKTYLLHELASNMPSLIPNLQILGPYHTSKGDINARIMDDLSDLRFLETPLPRGVALDWYSNWNWLRDNLKTSNRQNFLVLVRLDDNNFTQYEELRVWLSSVRYMEHYWTNNKVRLVVVVAGHWNHIGLENYYREINTSFPYTTSTNYMVWNKISLDETVELTTKRFNSSDVARSLGVLIYEITGGYAGAIIDIFEFLPSNDLTVASIFQATDRAAKDGRYGQLLVHTWQKLPAVVMEPIKKLLLFQRLRDGDKKLLDLLVVAGIIVYHGELGKSYAQISSRYIELLLKNNAGLLGISGEDWQRTQFSEFAPSIVALNVEAYKIINNIENLIRNFAITRLGEQVGEGDHVLQNKVIKRKNSFLSNVEEDAYERATDWRGRSRQNGMNVSLNPLIMFLSTGDLVQLMTELSSSGDPLWSDILEAIKKATPIRDAVMHNQVIDEKSLENLYYLQSKVIHALNWQRF